MPKYWVVERILACRPIDQSASSTGGQIAPDSLEFQVKWEGSAVLTWIRVKNFAGGKRSPMLNAFLKARCGFAVPAAVPKAIDESDDNMPLSRLAPVPAASAATSSSASATSPSAQPAIDLDARAMEEYMDHVSLPTWFKLQAQMSVAAHGDV
jgi:hypothetical protein